MMRFFLSMAYDGTSYHGWQVQDNASTIQEAVNKALTILLRHKVNVVGCGRTDSGVHASFFVSHFDVDLFEWDREKFIYKLNALLPKDIVVFDIAMVDSNLHARFDASAREYHYIIAKKYNPFLRDYAAFLRKKIDIVQLNYAAEIVEQHTDFTSFCKLHSDTKSNICHVSKSTWFENEGLLVYNVRSDRFLRNMVRALVGTMLDVGTGAISLEGFKEIFNQRNRSAAGVSAEAKGLFLSGVWYPKQVFSSHCRIPIGLSGLNIHDQY